MKHFSLQSKIISCFSPTHNSAPFGTYNLYSKIVKLEGIGCIYEVLFGHVSVSWTSWKLPVTGNSRWGTFFMIFGLWREEYKQCLIV
jgi:hypothetical protein